MPMRAHGMVADERQERPAIGTPGAGENRTGVAKWATQWKPGRAERPWA